LPASWAFAAMEPAAAAAPSVKARRMADERLFTSSLISVSKVSGQRNGSGQIIFRCRCFLRNVLCEADQHIGVISETGRNQVWSFLTRPPETGNEPAQPHVCGERLF